MAEALRGAHLYLDCYAGIAGDMMLGALLELGVPRRVVDEALGGLGLPAAALEVSTVRRAGLAGTKVDVRYRGSLAGGAHGPVIVEAGHGHEGDHDHVHYTDIRALISGRCAPAVAELALGWFDSLAQAEAKRHGVSVDDVVFHELGAIDSIADLVGCAAAIAWLAPARVSSRVVPVGGGTVRTAHGRLPVPAPATLELLTGCELEGGTVEDGELTTPTGAAIVRGLCLGPRGAGFGPMPQGRALAIGWGAGTRDTPGRPNLLRVVAIEARAEARGPSDAVEVLEANVDDLSPVLAAPLVEALLAVGALDAWLTPIVMKKGRPGLLVSALVRADRRVAVEEVFFRESTTIGLRRSGWERTVLDREIVELATELGPVAVKLAGRRNADGRIDPVYSATPELEACRRVAAERGISLRRVYEIVAAAASDVERNLIS